jgi:LacI family transcriptional regulator
MGMTVGDIAQAAGVSQATAARALGGYGSVSEDARRRVLAAAERLGYHRNEVAASLVAGSTRTIGLVVGDIENPFFAAAARGLTDVVEAEGQTVLLANSDEDSEREREAVAALRGRRVDGLVVATAASSEADHLRATVDAGVPVVLLDRPVSGLKLDTVMVDNEAGAARAVRHLADHGHRRIGMVTDTLDIGSSAERVRGFRRGARQAEVEVDESLIAVGGATQEEGYRGAFSLLERRDRPTALFTANNFMTYGALLAIREVGLAIPDEIAIVGFDDFVWATLVNPPITVVSQPVGRLGQEAGRLLLERIHGNGGEPRRIRLRTKLISRGSAGEETS